MTGKLQFETLDPVSHTDAEAAFSGGNPERIARMLVTLSLRDTDWKWVEGQCLRFLVHRNELVVSAAIIALGHTARINRSLDTDIVLPVLHALAADERYAGKVQDAVDDIGMFVSRAGKQ